MTMAHNALVTVGCFEIGMLSKELRDLGFHGQGEQGARSVAQNIGKWVVEGPWLNQLGDVMV